MTSEKLKSYKFNLFRNNETATVKVGAANYQSAEKELFLAGYSLQYGEWMINNFVIEGRGKQDGR